MSSDGNTLRKWPAFAAFAIAYLLSSFLRSSHAVIADDLTRDLNVDASRLGIMTAAFLLSFAIAQLPVGRALDDYGARTVVPVLMTVAVAGTVIVAVAPGFWVMAAGRAVQGLGLSGILMGGLKALSTHFPGRRFTVVSAELVAFGAVGGMLAATPLEWLASEIGWRLALGLTAIALAAAASAVATWGGAPFPGTPERREGFVRVFAARRLWRTIFVAFVLAGSLLAIQGLWAGPYLTEVHGLSRPTAGNLLLVLNGGLVGGYLVAGRLGRRVGEMLSLLVALCGFVLVQLILAFAPPVGVGALAGLLFLLGATGSFHVLLYRLGEQRFPKRMTGHVVTAVNLSMFTGGFVLQSAMGILVDAGGPFGLGGHGSALLLTAGLCGVAVLATVPELRAAPDQHLEEDS